MSDAINLINEMGAKARQAASAMAKASTAQKNAALQHIADALIAGQAQLVEANQRDMQAARDKGLDAAMLDRLELTPARIEAMANGLRQIATLPDPVGALSETARQPSGLLIGKMRVPLGVIGIIYESRPNVTADAGALCLKSGNCAILRGGSESFHSSSAIVAMIRTGLAQAGLPEDAVQSVNTPDRAAVGALITAEQWVDVIIPRGGKNLIQRISAEARVPVIKHLDGLCHVYIDAHADLSMAADVAFNAKTYRYGICGAMETLLVNREISAQVLPDLIRCYREHGVEVRGDEAVCALDNQVLPATSEDWATEYLAPVLSIKVVEDIEAAIAHINHYGSGHTDSIITDSLAASEQFIREVDSSSVMVNAPTNFADGFEYGLGAEIGISTNRLHVRGPVGLEGLTTQKFVVRGNGQLRGVQ